MAKSKAATSTAPARAAAKTIRKISDLIPDDRNANKGTERGKGVISKSLRELGAGRSILLDREGRIIAGNKTAENALKAGIKNIQVIQTDGTKLIAVQRIDLDLKQDKKAKELAIADNRSAELNLAWDAQALSAIGKEIDLTPYFSTEELAKHQVSFAAGEGKEAQTMEENLTYSVIVDCKTEEQQVALLERLEKENYQCRLLIS